jgi:Protein of unknown function (DUF2581).
MASPDASSASVFVSLFNRILAVVIWAVDAFVIVAVLLGTQADRGLTLIPGVFVALFAWAALWHPSVDVDDERVRIVNVFRTIEIPWAALIHVDTRYALTLFTPGHRFAAWAAPAPGRTGTTIARRAERSGRVGEAPRPDGTVRPGDLLASESGQAAAIVRDTWHRLRDSGAIETGSADATPVTVRWHWVSDGALILLTAASVVALLLLRF